MFLFVINERICKVLSRKGLDVYSEVLSIKATVLKSCMVRFLVISQTIADFPDTVKFEDDSFDGDGKHSEVYRKSTSCFKEQLPWKFVYSTHEKEDRRP